MQTQAWWLFARFGVHVSIINVSMSMTRGRNETMKPVADVFTLHQSAPKFGSPVTAGIYDGILAFLVLRPHPALQAAEIRFEARFQARKSGSWKWAIYRRYKDRRFRG